MTFRNLPLTPEQDAEIHGYIERCKRRGESWDTLALDYTLNEMLRENEERTIGERVPRVLALLAVEKAAAEELADGRTMPSPHLRVLAVAAGLEPFATLDELEDEAYRIKNELLAANK